MPRNTVQTPRDLNRLTLERLFVALAANDRARDLAKLSRLEDQGSAGDVTSDASIPPRARGEGRIVARSAGTVAGLAALEEFRRQLAPNCRVIARARDGRQVRAGTTLALVRGPLREILAFERPALNLLGRLSGIATRTAMFVRALPRGTRAALYDTRKTTPGLRVLEKYAVRCGGGRCHRIGLFDAVLVKDNHIAGIPAPALGLHARGIARLARQRADPAFVEVEVDSLAQLESVLRAQAGAPREERVDIVLLDNMAPGVLKRAAAMRDRLAPAVELEASGGVTLDSLPAIARTGVERISAGTLTHGATWLDVALDIESSPPARKRARRA